MQISGFIDKVFSLGLLVLQKNAAAVAQWAGFGRD
jgi:hypothetical protein